MSSSCRFTGCEESKGLADFELPQFEGPSYSVPVLVCPSHRLQLAKKYYVHQWHLIENIEQSHFSFHSDALLKLQCLWAQQLEMDLEFDFEYRTIVRLAVLEFLSSRVHPALVAHNECLRALILGGSSV